MRTAYLRSFWAVEARSVLDPSDDGWFCVAIVDKRETADASPERRVNPNGYEYRTAEVRIVPVAD